MKIEILRGLVATCWSNSIWMPLLLIFALTIPVFAQGPASPQGDKPLDGREGRELLLRSFRPKSMLRVEQHLLTRAKFPVIDIHSHFRVRFRESPEQLEQYLQVMNRNQIAVSVSLDGQLGDALDSHLRYFEKHPKRFAVFANIDWMGAGKPAEPATWACNRDDFARVSSLALVDARKQGACGVRHCKIINYLISDYAAGRMR